MKKFISFIILILTLTLLGCDVNSNQLTFTFSRDNPIPITLDISNEITDLIISNNGKEISFSIHDLDNYIDNNNLVLNESFFDSLENGTYTFTLVGKTNIKLSITINGEIYKFKEIDKLNAYTQADKKYYVLFQTISKESIKLRSELRDFDEFLNSFPENAVGNLYIVNDSIDTDSFETTKSLTLAVIENGNTTSYYNGYTDISAFLSIEKKNINNKNILHNIDDPKVLKVDIDFVPERYSVTNTEGKVKSYKVPEEYTEDSTGYSSGKMYFSASLFNSWDNGTYKLTIYNDTDSFEANLFVTSIFTHISASEIFNRPEEKYYVFFLKYGCSGCNYVKPTLLEYSQNYSSYNSNLNYPIFAVHRDRNPEIQKCATSDKAKENFIGVTNLDDFKFYGYPRVVLIENGVITEVYKNEGNAILAHFSSIMK